MVSNIVIVLSAAVLFLCFALYRCRYLEMEQFATTDELTGLANRRVWNSLLNFIDKERAIPVEMKKDFFNNRRRKRPVGVSQKYLVLLDIDFFKKVNDTHGHDIGDIVLKKMAQEMQKHMREGEVLARIGGEEFAAMIYSDSQGCEAFLKKLRLHVEEHLTFAGANGDFNITISMGYVPIDDSTPTEDLMKQADKALYQAKENGRNQVVLATAA